MLEAIEIQGYKSIREAKISLGRINVLIGPNGVGKSNFLSFLRLLHRMARQQLQHTALMEGADSMLYYGRKRTGAIKASIVLGSRKYDELEFGRVQYSFSLVPTTSNSLIIGAELIYFIDNNSLTEWVSNPESYLLHERRAWSDWQLGDLHRYVIYHFHDTTPSSPLRQESDIDNNRVLKADGGNLAAFLYYMQEKHPNNFGELERLVRRAVPSFDRFHLAPKQLKPEKIQLEWIDLENPDGYFNAQHLSDGSLRFIALSTVLLQPEPPPMVIIDEPELGLHPQSLSLFAALVKGTAARGTQIVLTTQSVELLDHFEVEDIITVNRHDGQSVFERLDREQLNDWLEDYTLGELWEKNVIEG